MKCGNLILIGYKTKRSRTLSIVKSVSWRQTADRGHFPLSNNIRPTQEYLDRGYVVCDGAIKVSVKAIIESDYLDCGHAADRAGLQITYRCNRCLSTFYPHLPDDDEEELSRFLTDAVAEMESESLIAKTIAKWNEHDRLMKEMAAKANPLPSRRRSPRRNTIIDSTKPESNGAAIIGRKGGLARANSLTPEQRRKIAQKAANTRWKH